MLDPSTIGPLDFAQTFAMFLSQSLELSPFQHSQSTINGLSTEWQVTISILTMFSFAVINCMPIRFQGVLNYIGTLVQLITTFAVILTLIISCPTSASSNGFMAKTVSQVLFTSINGTGLDDSYLVYVCMIGSLGAFYSFVGYEASGHLGEETKNPSLNVPRGILYTCVASALTGLCYLLCLLVAVAGNVQGFLEHSNPSVFLIFTQCTSSIGTLLLSILLIVNVYFSGSKYSKL
jgi:amino acid transporter